MAVAIRVIYTAERKGIRITPFKAIKLMFLANQAYEILHGQPLIVEKFTATQYGPNLFSVFILLKPFGSGFLNPNCAYLIPWKAKLKACEERSIDDAVENWLKLSDQDLIDLTRYSFEPQTN